jgi:MFS family permease
VVDELLHNRDARRLVVGYTAHNWELVGMWTWIPAFLAAAFVTQGADGGVALAAGAYVAGLLHLFGAVSAFSMGTLSDRVGRRTIMVGLAAAGAIISFALGWLLEAPLLVLVPIALIYAFVCLGDSPVLTTALAEVVRPGYLGAILAWRALFGFGAGAAAPLAFGLGFDFFANAGSSTLSWVAGFSILGLGGAGALACALARNESSD